MNTLALNGLYKPAYPSHLFDLLSAQVGGSNYPPCNIERLAEGRWRIVLAVAGFREADLGISLRERTLTVTGERPAEPDGAVVLHRGLALRQFARQFVLAEHIVVAGAHLDSGLLVIELERIVPESARARTIPIGSRTH